MFSLILAIGRADRQQSVPNVFCYELLFYNHCFVLSIVGNRELEFVFRMGSTISYTGTDMTNKIFGILSDGRARDSSSRHEWHQ